MKKFVYLILLLLLLTVLWVTLLIQKPRSRPASLGQQDINEQDQKRVSFGKINPSATPAPIIQFTKFLKEDFTGNRVRNSGWVKEIAPNATVDYLNNRLKTTVKTRGKYQAAGISKIIDLSGDFQAKFTLVDFSITQNGTIELHLSSSKNQTAFNGVYIKAGIEGDEKYIEAKSYIQNNMQKSRTKKKWIKPNSVFVLRRVGSTVDILVGDDKRLDIILTLNNAYQETINFLFLGSVVKDGLEGEVAAVFDNLTVDFIKIGPK